MQLVGLLSFSGQFWTGKGRWIIKLYLQHNFPSNSLNIMNAINDIDLLSLLFNVAEKS